MRKEIKDNLSILKKWLKWQNIGDMTENNANKIAILAPNIIFDVNLVCDENDSQVISSDVNCDFVIASELTNLINRERR